MLVSHKHPSLPGHFPGDPIVPAVVILDQVLRLWQNKTNKNITQFNNSKFIQILRADTPCIIHYKKTKHPGKIDFEIMVDNQKTIAKGSFNYD